MTNEEMKAIGFTDQDLVARENQQNLKAWMLLNGFVNENGENRRFAGMIVGRAFQLESEPLPDEIREGFDGENGFVKANFAMDARFPVGTKLETKDNAPARPSLHQRPSRRTSRTR